MKHKILNITSIALFSLSITQPTFAAPECDAILQHGVFDKSNILDQESKFNMVKDTYCRSSSKNSGLDYADSSVELGLSHAETEQLCKSNFQQTIQNSNYKSAISKASTTIANAWQACIRDNKGGLSHYIQPTSDKNKFTYKITYTPDGDPPAARITSWDISDGASCKRPPTSGQSINSGGYEIQCTRNSNQSVIITVNADRGTKNLKTLELPPYREHKEESTKSKILTGKEFRIVFDGSCPNDSTNYTGSSDPMGTLLCGETYRAVYTQYNKEWVITGFNEGEGRVGTWKYTNADLNSNKISLWGRVYEFDESRNVHDSEYGIVGHIYFSE